MTTLENAEAAGPAGWRETLHGMPLLPLLMVAVAAHMMLFGMLTPVMAVYAQTFGVSEWQIGLMVTVFAAGRLIADLPAGYAAPKIGLKPLLVVGLLLCSAGALIGAVAPSFATLLAGRTMQGVGSGLFMTAAMYYCARQSDRRSRGKVMSLFQGSTLIGAAFGPSVGGFSAAAFGVNGPFYVAAVIGFVAGIVPLIFIQDARPERELETDLPTKHINLLLILPFACVLMVNFGLFLTRTAAQWQMIPLMAYERFDIGPEHIGLALSLSAVATLMVLPLAAYLVDWAPRRLVIAISITATGIALLSITFAPTVDVLYAAMIAMGMASGIGGPAVAAYAVDVSPPGQHGPAMGMVRFAGDLGYLVGPLSIGALIDATGIGHSGGISVNAALLIFVALIFAVLASPRKSRRNPNQGE